MRNHRTTIYRIGTGTAALAIVAFIQAGIGLYRQREAVEAEIVTKNYAARPVNQFRGQPGGQNDTYLSSGDIVAYDGRRYRRNNYARTVLCMGVDRVGEMAERTTTGFGGQADRLFPIAQDTVCNTLKVPIILRDTMIDITLTDLSGDELGKDLQHLNLVYAYGDGREKNCEYMVEAVSGLLGGLKIKWYPTAGASAVPMLNDEVGGIAMTIKIDGMKKQDSALTKGETVTPEGKQVEIFVRFRDVHMDRSTLFRMDQQQQYIKSFFETVQKGVSHGNGLVVRLFGEVQDYVATNMAKGQYFKIAMGAVGNGKLNDEDLYTVPGGGVVTPRYDEFYADKDALIPVVLELFYRELK